MELPGVWKGGSEIRNVSGETRFTRRGTADSNRIEMKAESNSRKKKLIVIPRKKKKFEIFWAREKKSHQEFTVLVVEAA